MKPKNYDKPVIEVYHANLLLREPGSFKREGTQQTKHKRIYQNRTLNKVFQRHDLSRRP
jgi:hypothetical protein